MIEEKLRDLVKRRYEEEPGGEMSEVKRPDIEGTEKEFKLIEGTSGIFAKRILSCFNWIRHLEAENAKLEMKYDAAIETANALDLDRERLEKLERLVKQANRTVELDDLEGVIQVTWGYGKYSTGSTLNKAIDALEEE